MMYVCNVYVCMHVDMYACMCLHASVDQDCCKREKEIEATPERLSDQKRRWKAGRKVRMKTRCERAVLFSFLWMDYKICLFVCFYMYLSTKAGGLQVTCGHFRRSGMDYVMFICGKLSFMWHSRARPQICIQPHHSPSQHCCKLNGVMNRWVPSGHGCTTASQRIVFLKISPILY